MKRTLFLAMMTVAIGCGGADSDDAADGRFGLAGGSGGDEVAADQFDEDAPRNVASDDAVDEAPDVAADVDADVADSDDVDDGDADLQCQPDECGPAPGAPNILCDDGSIGGPVCDRDDRGQCGWEIRECPEVKECSLEDCGPAPAAPGYLCIDGSWGGPVCGRLDDGTCGYSFHQCPVECKPELCGPEPDWAILTCDDGSESGPICVTDGDPVTDDGCMWKQRECP